MPESRTIRVEPHVGERLNALAEARGVRPGELVADLVLGAETAELVAEVNAELERLAQPPAQRSRKAQMRRLETTVSGWMRD